MTIQNYLMIENNIVTNICVWDGDTNTWQPPADAIILVQATTPALIWESSGGQTPEWVLTEVMGAGEIGFTWNTTTQVLTTNQPKPTIPATTSGTQPA